MNKQLNFFLVISLLMPNVFVKASSAPIKELGGASRQASKSLKPTGSATLVSLDGDDGSKSKVQKAAEFINKRLTLIATGIVACSTALVVGFTFRKEITEALNTFFAVPPATQEATITEANATTAATGTLNAIPATTAHNSLPTTNATRRASVTSQPEPVNQNLDEQVAAALQATENAQAAAALKAKHELEVATAAVVLLRQLEKNFCHRSLDSRAALDLKKHLLDFAHDNRSIGLEAVNKMLELAKASATDVLIKISNESRESAKSIKVSVDNSTLLFLLAAAAAANPTDRLARLEKPGLFNKSTLRQQLPKSLELTS